MQVKNTSLPQPYIESIVHRHLRGHIRDLTPLEGGNFSKAYSFRIGTTEYVFRCGNPAVQSYERETFLAELLCAQGVPYPRVFGTGRTEEHVYCISERIRGVMLASLPQEQQVALLPELVSTVAAMNAVELRGASGFGFLGDDYNGRYDSWEHFVMSFFSREQTGTYWEDWYELFDTTFMEKAVFDACYARLLQYGQYNAPHRHFVHHDCHPWNMMTDGRTITGILDSNCIYGDFLIDVATLELYFPDADIAGLFEARYAAIGLDVPDLQERLIGARLFKGLDCMRFYAKMGWEHAYEEVRNRLLAL